MYRYSFIKGLYNNYGTLSCLYVKFHWLISHVQLSFQPLSVNVLHRLMDSRGGHGGAGADLIHTGNYGSPRSTRSAQFRVI